MSDHSSHGMTDTVFIEGLKVDAIIGVYAWERVITQPLRIDVCLTGQQGSMDTAAQSDDVTDAINYKAVCDDIKQWCTELQPKLLERLAVHLADSLLDKYPCQQVTLKVAKPTAVTEAAAVGVQISRRKAAAH